jgi:hypothetical protein
LDLTILVSLTFELIIQEPLRLLSLITYTFHDSSSLSVHHVRHFKML